jgi:hypothetical protein
MIDFLRYEQFFKIEKIDKMNYEPKNEKFHLIIF